MLALEAGLRNVQPGQEVRAESLLGLTLPPGMPFTWCGGQQSGDDQREAFKSLKPESCLEALPLWS